MNCQEFSDVLIDVYYGDADAAVRHSSKQHKTSCKTCEASWQSISGVSQAYRALSDEAPTQLSYNKILVYARERCERKKRPFWRVIWQPAASFALMATFAVMSFVQFSAQPVQQWATTVPSLSPMVSLPELRNRVYNTSFDQPRFNDDYKLNQFLQSGAQVMPASQGFQGLENLTVADDMDHKMLGRNLDVHELETLYYRARKMEKLGAYREAFNDYEFITKFYPRYGNSRFALLGMARCLQGLEQNDEAVLVLNRYMGAFGPSEDAQNLLDSLKSETF